MAPTCLYKAVILIGGPQKGTRFRPLSFDHPKPLFPVAGIPTIQHLIEACILVKNLKEILIIGHYHSEGEVGKFVMSMNRRFKDENISIRYLQEYAPLGTAGCIYHFRDEIMCRNPEAIYVINGDVCGDFPLTELSEFHKSKNGALITILATEATQQQSKQYGCIVEDRSTNRVVHYVEKPSTYVSHTINCGVYMCSLDIFTYLANLIKEKSNKNFLSDAELELCNLNSYLPTCISMEQDVLTSLAGTGKFYVFHNTRWWSQIKTAGSAIYANRHYLELYKDIYPERLCKKNIKDTASNITIGGVFIHPTAHVHAKAVLGPNVSIGQNVVIREGVRIKECIVLGDACIHENSLLKDCIIGWSSTVGAWSRVEGTPCDPNPDKPFAKMENASLFNGDGRLHTSITVLGSSVQVQPGLMVLNCIVLPHKELSHDHKNEIIL